LQIETATGLAKNSFKGDPGSYDAGNGKRVLNELAIGRQHFDLISEDS